MIEPELRELCLCCRHRPGGLQARVDACADGIVRENRATCPPSIVQYQVSAGRRAAQLPRAKAFHRWVKVVACRHTPAEPGQRA